MRKIVLFEDHACENLLPLLYWRSVFELRCGRKTLMDRIVVKLEQNPSGIWTRDWIARVAGHRCQLPVNRPIDDATVLVNGRWLSARPIEVKRTPFLATSEGSVVYLACDRALAERLSPAVLLDESRWREELDGVPSEELGAELIQYPWDLVVRNADVLCDDWQVTDCSTEGFVSASAFLLRADYVHVGERSVVKPAAIIDAEPGPVFISSDVTIEPHTYVAGPAYIGPGTVIKPHTTISGGTTIGPVCRVGGEIHNCIISGYTTKEHEGYLGRSFLCNWVNIGPGTANTDIKSTYGHVRVMVGRKAVDTNLTAFGAIIADHTRIGTNQKIPNGAVVGFAASAATGHFLPKFLPSFAWFTDSGLAKGDPAKLLVSANLTMATRNVELTEDEAELFDRLPMITRDHEEGGS